MPPRPEEELPLPALHSFLLVAFTIEFDNEFEHQVAHRTTLHRASDGQRQVPWLVSRGGGFPDGS
jgi:hypothetical protein